MSDTLFKLFGGALVCVLVTLILKKESPDTALVLRMVAGVGLAIVCIGAMTPVIEYVREIGESLGAGETVSSAASVMLKALGVALLTHISATVCRDAGEGSVAYYVELGGKIEILILSLPLMKEIIDMALGLIEKGA